MIRAPHPAFAELFRLAATPSRLLSRLKQNDGVLARVEVEPVAGGEGGDELLDPVLARLETPAATGEHQHSAPRSRNMPADASAEVRPPSMIPPVERAAREVRLAGPQPKPARHRAAAPSARPTISRAALPEPRPIARPVSFPQQPSNPVTEQPRTSATPQPAAAPPPDPLHFPAAATPPRRHAAGTLPLPLPDATAAQEALAKRAARRGVIQALHQPVGRDVPPRVAVVLQQSVVEPPQAAPNEPPLQRLAATVDRIEHAGSRRAAPATAPMAPDDRGTVVPVAALSRDLQPLAPPVGGFRGLVALVEAQRPRSAAPPPAPAEKIAPPPAPTLDDAALTARISEILRRDAERHGIDMTGVEP